MAAYAVLSLYTAVACFTATYHISFIIICLTFYINPHSPEQSLKCVIIHDERKPYNRLYVQKKKSHKDILLFIDVLQLIPQCA